MNAWFGYGVGAAVLYGLHQVFTKLAAPHVTAGLGGLIVEATAAATIGGYLAFLASHGGWQESVNTTGAAYSVLTGLCVGAGTVLFFLLFHAGAPLSAAPAILAAGAAIMAVAGIAFFGEEPTVKRLLAVGLSVAGLYLSRAG